MNILVDKLPENPRECLFSISSTDRCLYNCKLKMDDDYDWEHRTFNGHCKCSLSENKDCPYLKRLLDHFGTKPITVSIPDDTKENIDKLRDQMYASIGISQELLDQSSGATLRMINEYQEKKFQEHLNKEINNSCYREPVSWDDFVSNRKYNKDERF
ncbi:MAG: hypothetical protein J6R47_00210 [Acholeplasmatales bacterium]|nr:hypothetical protein [Acholeplasmatales bacterium]